MMRWTRGRYAIEMTDEPFYSFGSADNAHSYAHEILLESDYRPSSKHGLQCSVDGKPRGSAVLGASGGGTGIHEHACVLLANRCLVAVGNRVAALRLPNLVLLWQARADDATCFGLHVTPDENHVLVHGELEIGKFTPDGHTKWKYAGQDIFTGTFAVNEGNVLVTDFNGQRYSIGLDSGCGMIVGGG